MWQMLYSWKQEVFTSLSIEKNYDMSPDILKKKGWVANNYDFGIIDGQRSLDDYMFNM